MSIREWSCFERVISPREDLPASWPTLRWIVIGGLLLRLAAALISERTFAAEEIFYYLEQAHRLVYGYGYVPWEFRYGVRNWMLPSALAVLLEMCKAAGLTSPAHYVPVMKAVMAVISLSVIPAVFAIGRQLYDEQTGRVAAVLSAFWFELIYFSSVATNEIFAAYALAAALALILGANVGPGRIVMAGVLCGLVVSLRLSYAPTLLILYGVIWLRGGWGACALAGVGMVLPLGIAGGIDLWMWRTPFISYYLALFSNASNAIASLVEQQSAWFYVKSLWIVSAGLFLIVLAAASRYWRRHWLLLSLIVAVLLPASAMLQKSQTVALPAIILCLVLVAWFCTAVIPALMTRTRISSGRVSEYGGRAVGVVLCAVVSLLGLFAKLPMLESRYPNAVFSRDDLLLASLALSKQPDVEAVLNLVPPWSQTGGYYYWHKKVPVYDAEALARVLAPVGKVVSHVLCRNDTPPISGYDVVARFGQVELRAQLTRPAEGYRRLSGDFLRMPQPGITDRFKPRVRARF